MSPLSKVKELLKSDVDSLKKRANQSFYKHLNEKQILHYEYLLSKKDPQHFKSSVHEDQIDPIGYYEHRYFPYGFDDPAKLQHYHPHHFNAKGDLVEDENPVKGDQLSKIAEFEKRDKEENDKIVEGSAEREFDRR